MKTIVTHLSPDVDSITSCWLIKRFLPGWKNAQIRFVPAGSSLNNQPPDENPEIIHVDTGLGRFDHHQTNNDTCAAKKVLEYLIKKNYIKGWQICPLQRLITFVNEIDHFGEVYFPEATSDRYEFLFSQIIEGLKPILKEEEKITEEGFILLEAIFNILKNKVKAEEEVQKGFIFQSIFGKSIALETRNEEATKLALKMGFHLVIRKDPKAGFVRIKTAPNKKLDLGPLYQKIIRKDGKGSWFLHVSHHMLLNFSSKNPHFVATPLTLPQLIEIVKTF